MTETGPRVVGIGNALVDHTFRLTNIPEPDGGAYVLNRERRFGGVETNVVVAVEALGVPAGIIARLGSDEDGATVRSHLDSLDIDTSRVRQVSGDQTAYTHVLTDPEGRRVIIGGGDSTLNMHLDADDTAMVGAADVTFTSAYAPWHVLETLSEMETQVVYDLAGSFEDLERRGLSREALTSVLGEIECFVTNIAAGRSYIQTPEADPEEIVRGLRQRGATRGAVTNGRDGSVLFDDSGLYEVDAITVDVKDTTGAGDAFTAGLIVAWLLEGREPIRAGRFAAAAAAANCQVEGAHEDPPSRADVRSLLG